MAKELIKNILKYQPEKRYSLDKIMSNPWIKDKLDKTFIRQLSQINELNESFTSNVSKYISENESKINQTMQNNNQAMSTNELRASIRPEFLMNSAMFGDIGDSHISTNKIPVTMKKPTGINQKDHYKNNLDDIDNFRPNSTKDPSFMHSRFEKPSMAMGMEKEITIEHLRRRAAEKENIQLKNRLIALEMKLAITEHHSNWVQKAKNELDDEKTKLQHKYTNLEQKNKELQAQYNNENSEASQADKHFDSNQQGQIQHLQTELKAVKNRCNEMDQIPGMMGSLDKKSKILFEYNQINEEMLKQMQNKFLDKNAQKDIFKSLKQLNSLIEKVSKDSKEDLSLLKSYKDVASPSELIQALQNEIG